MPCSTLEKNQSDTHFEVGNIINSLLHPSQVANVLSALCISSTNQETIKSKVRNSYSDFLNKQQIEVKLQFQSTNRVHLGS